MKFQVLIALSLLITQSACVIDASGGERGTRTSSPDEFDGLAVSGGFDLIEVEVCDDCEPQVILDGDDRQIDDVTLEIKGSTLELSRRNSWVVTGIDLRAKVRTPRLRAFTNTTSSDATLEGVKSNVFELVSTGSGDTTISGRVGVLDIVNSGSGTIHAYDLTADSVQVITSGSGGAEVCADDRLEANTTGSGNVFFDCSPSDTDFNSTGSGRVSVR